MRKISQCIIVKSIQTADYKMFVDDALKNLCKLLESKVIGKIVTDEQKVRKTQAQTKNYSSLIMHGLTLNGTFLFEELKDCSYTEANYLPFNVSGTSRRGQ